MNIINIENLINNNTNLIEIYLYDKKNINNDFYINLNISDNIINKVKSIYNNSNKNNFKYYYYNNLIYIYDLSNDSQVVYYKKFNGDININTKNNMTNLYICSYHEQKNPTYIFPCTNNINNISDVNITEFKINNRISINIKDENNNISLYIKYTHSNNVDIDKVNNTINNIYKNIIS